jgi:hypothetical protein
MCCFDDVAREATSRCDPEAADSRAQLTALWLSREGRHGCKYVAKCSKHQVLWCSSITASGEMSRQDATLSGMGKRRMTTSQRASLHKPPQQRQLRLRYVRPGERLCATSRSKVAVLPVVGLLPLLTAARVIQPFTMRPSSTIVRLPAVKLNISQPLKSPR